MTTPEQNADVASVIAALEAKPVRSVGKNRTITISAGGDTKAKIAPQGRTILIALLKSGKSEITENELATLLESDEVKTALKTKQPTWRIWAFHRKEIMDAGFLAYKA